jgi:undecaprenyl-diphosphatase
LELQLLYQLQGLHNPILDTLMVFITHTGDHGLLWIALSVGLMAFKKTRLWGITMLLSLALGYLLGNLLLKNIVLRPRPSWVDLNVPLLIQNPKDYSFPSGHTLAAFSAGFSLLQYNRLWGILTLFWAGLIGFSRLYLFVHYPSDVLASILLSLWITTLVGSWLRKTHWFQ